MRQNDYGPVGLYFEEFEVGMTMRSRGRTITEADVVSFAGLTGDYNPMHTSAKYAQTTEFGQRVAHGMLSLSYAVGQAYQLGFLEQTTLAFRELEMKFSLPVLLGDTIHVDIAVKETKPMARLGGGVVAMGVKVVNQDGKTVQKGTWTMLMASKPTESS